MNKNLVLVRNGYPASATSGTVVDSLDIRDFFKFEKNVVPSLYANYYTSYAGYAGASSAPVYLSPFPETRINMNSSTDAVLQKCVCPSAYYEKEGELKYNNTFKHYSVSLLLFAVRMNKGYLGTNVTITSRLSSDSPLKLRFFDIGEALADFEALKAFKRYAYNGTSTDYKSLAPHKPLSNALSIPTLNQYNHCFLAALFSDSVYEKETGTVLLDNEPLLNISWTETAFTTEG